MSDLNCQLGKMLTLLSHRLKQLLWDRLEESGWRYDVEEHAKGTFACYSGMYSPCRVPLPSTYTSIAQLL